jgi:hypothetical protein
MQPAAHRGRAPLVAEACGRQPNGTELLRALHPGSFGKGLRRGATRTHHAPRTHAPPPTVSNPFSRRVRRALSHWTVCTQDHGPYFKEITATTSRRQRLSSKATGNELMDVLTTSEDVLDTLLRQLSAKDLGRLECTCRVLWSPNGDGPIELFAQRLIQSRIKTHTVRRPDRSSFVRLLSCILVRPTLVLHGPDCPARHRPQPFLYPGQPSVRAPTSLHARTRPLPRCTPAHRGDRLTAKSRC